MICLSSFRNSSLLTHSQLSFPPSGSPMGDIGYRRGGGGLSQYLGIAEHLTVLRPKKGCPEILLEVIRKQKGSWVLKKRLNF